MTPSVFLQDADCTLWHGDVLETLRELAAESVDCVVTSPPYWGLRDYGTGAWEGGDAECDHAPEKRGGRFATEVSAKQASNTGSGTISDRDCKCGATRIDQQLGLEPTPEQYVERMVEVFQEVRRVLAAHGTCWINLGDSYARAGGDGDCGPNAQVGNTLTRGRQKRMMRLPEQRAQEGLQPAAAPSGISLKAKDLVGVPWRVAFALQADGWYLRSDIIWSKPNPMPESVTDRPTKAHEYLFLLSKAPRYFFDQEAVRERYEDEPERRYGRVGAYQNRAMYGIGDGTTPTRILTDEEIRRQRSGGPGARGNGDARALSAEETGRTDGFTKPPRNAMNPAGRNIRSVWEIATMPFSGNALGGGTSYRASPDCPKHGLLVSRKRWQRAADGERPDQSSYRIDSSDARLALERLAELEATTSHSLASPANSGERTPGSAPESRTPDPSPSVDSQVAVESVALRTTRSESSHAPQAGSSDSLLLPDASIATLHSKGNRRTVGQSAEGDTAGGETPGGTPYTLPSHETPEPSDFDSPGSSETPADTSRTCTCARIVQDHFATFPEELARRAIAAGCPEQVCRVCGKARERVVEHSPNPYPGSSHDHTEDLTGPGAQRHASGVPAGTIMAKRFHERGPRTTAGFTDCGHADYRPGIILDPFMGSGTVGHVARKLNRHSIGIDLSAEYLALAAKRLQQQSLFAEAL